MHRRRFSFSAPADIWKGAQALREMHDKRNRHKGKMEMKKERKMKTNTIMRFVVFWGCVASLIGLIAFRIISSRTGGTTGGDGTNRIGSVTVASSKPTAAEVEKLHEIRRLQLAEAKLKADVELRLKKFESDLSALSEKYKKMLPLADAEKSFQDSMGGARFLASRDGLCGFKVCVSLAYKMAYDKLKGTTRTADAIEPLVLSRICEPMEEAVGVYAKWTEDYRHELQKEEQVFALDLAAVANDFSDKIAVLTNDDAKRASAAIDGFVASIKDHAKETVYATIGAAIEAAMIKTSYDAIKKIVLRIVARTLASSAAKIGASATTGAACAVVDGPLPIMDFIGAVITVAGLSWTACDIYAVTKSMPDEMQVSVESEIVKTKSALTNTALENLKKAHATCLASARERVNEIVKSL